MRAASSRKKIEYIGSFEDHSILIGSHGHTKVKVKGTFSLSGIIYSPKYTVTLSVEGSGSIRFRGICDAVVIKKLSGDCEIDLSELICRDLRVGSMRGKSKLIAGKVRTIQAIVFDEASVFLSEKPLISNIMVSEDHPEKMPVNSPR